MGVLNVQCVLLRRLRSILLLSPRRQTTSTNYALFLALFQTPKLAPSFSTLQWTQKTPTLLPTPFPPLRDLLRCSPTPPSRLPSRVSAPLPPQLLLPPPHQPAQAGSSSIGATGALRCLKTEGQPPTNSSTEGTTEFVPSAATAASPTPGAIGAPILAALPSSFYHCALRPSRCSARVSPPISSNPLSSAASENFIILVELYFTTIATTIMFTCFLMTLHAWIASNFLKLQPLLLSDVTFKGAGHDVGVAPIQTENRCKEEEARALATRQLLNCIVCQRMAVDSLTGYEKNAVSSECSKAEKWLRDKSEQQEALPRNVDPILWSHEIIKKIEELDLYPSI